MRLPTSTLEELRLRKIQEYEVLDSGYERAFDDITRLAALVCKAPIAAITIADGTRLYFKSCYGIEAKEMPREGSFCSYTMESSTDLFVVADATLDERFREHPLVVNEPYVRFYAGAPLVSPDGIILGTLGVLDRQPRSLDPEHETTLRLLADQVVTQLELKRALHSNDVLSQQCQLALTQAADGIHLFDFEGNILAVNPKFCEMMGRTEDELVSMKIQDLVPPEDLAQKPIRFEEMRGGRSFTSDRRFVRADGTIIDLELSVRRIDHETVSAISRDITELRKSQQIFDAYINNSPAVIFMKDLDGRYVTVNQSFEKFLNVRAEEIKDKTDFDLLPKEVAKVVRENDLTVLNTGETLETVEMVPDADGNENYWVSHKFLIEPKSGEKLLGGVSINITERKQMESELESARDAALESARLKSAFLTNVSHEIRTPMNGVIGMTELLIETPLDRTQREYAETIRQSSDALLTVINDILDLAKIEAGKLRFESADFDLRETIDATVELLARRAFQKNLEIASLIAPDVPAIVRGDAGRLRQVLTNLIGNAIKYTEQGEIGIRVETVSKEANSVTLRFTVSDTGIGIASESLRQLFQPFAQVDDSMTRRFGGTGLGLVISKQIVEMMNGDISVESKVGRGSSFSFTATFNQPEQIGRTGDAQQNSLDSRRIIIADDKNIIRQNLESYASRWGMETRTVPNGEELIAELQDAASGKSSFDIAVIDMDLPDWEGFALARRIKSDDALARTRIVLTTAFGQRGDAVEARESGVSAYLTKPIRGSQFFDCLSEVVKELDAPDSLIHESSTPPLVTRHTIRESKNRSRVRTGSTRGFPHLLVVEDNEINRRLLLRQLEQLGVSPDVAVDGIDALDKIGKKDYGLILMDCQMPRLDGYETTRELRRLERERLARGEQFKPATVIALTAHSLSGEREKCLDAGMDEYLAKPVKLGELSALIDQRFGRPPDARDESADGESIDDFDIEIIQLYLSETSKRIDEMASAGDAQKVARIAHAIRGNSLAVKDFPTAAIAGKIERIAEDHGLEGLPVLLEQLTKEIAVLSERFAFVPK